MSGVSLLPFQVPQTSVFSFPRQPKKVAGPKKSALFLSRAFPVCPIRAISFLCKRFEVAARRKRRDIERWRRAADQGCDRSTGRGPRGEADMLVAERKP